MSGPNTITIQVDATGALLGIQGVAEALERLGEAAQASAQQIQAMTAASSAIQVSVQAAQEAAQGISSLSNGMAELNQQFATLAQKLNEGESPFEMLIGTIPGVISALVDLHGMLGMVQRSAAMGALAAGISGSTTAMTAATAAVRVFGAAMSAIPILAIAAAVVTLGVGLYELLKGSDENTRAFKSMDEALRAMEPTLGRASDGVDTFMDRIAAASEARRALIKGGLTDVITAGEQELASQKQAIEELFSTVYSDRQMKNAGAGHNDAGLKALHQFRQDGDVEALYAALSKAGGKAKEVLDAVVTIDGQSKKLTTIGNEAAETREKIGGAQEKLHLLNGAMTGEAALKQTSAWNNATEALDAYGQTQDPIRTAAVAQAAALEKVAEALEKQAKASGDGAQMSLAAQTAAELRMRANDGLRKAEDEIAAAARRKAVADADAIKMSNFHADAKIHMAAVAKLEAEGTDEARLKVIELNAARKKEQLTLKENAELHQADANAQAEITARYAESRKAVDDEARAASETVKDEAKQRLAQVEAVERQTAEMQDAARIAALEREGTAEARAEIVKITQERKLHNLEIEKQTALEGKSQEEQLRIIETFKQRAQLIKDESAQAANEAIEKATKDQTDAATRAAQAQAEEVKKQADQIASGWADAMFDQITGKGDSIKNWFKGLFKQIASDALKNKIILPIVTGVLGGAAGLLGGGALGGVTQSAAAGALPAQRGLNSLLSGLTGAIGGLESGIANLGSSLFGTAGTSVFADRVLTTTPATEGLFGSGGTFLGSTDLASGLTGGLGGLGLGMTAAGLLGALGIGKGNTKGGAIGGAIGGAAGSIFFGPLGGTIGGLLGGAVGSLFGGKPSNKEGSAVINLAEDRYDVGGFTGKKYSQENRDAAAEIADKVLSIKDALEKGFGARITGTLAVGAGDRDGLFATALNSTARTRFSKDEAGMEQLVAYVTSQFVTGIKDQLAPEISAALGRVDFSDMDKAVGDLDFIRGFRDSLASLRGDFGLQNKVTEDAKQAVQAQTDAIRTFRDTTARLFPEAVGEADQALRTYVEGLVGIRDAASPMSQVEAAMMALKAQFEAYKPLLEEVGYTAEEAQTAIATGLTKAQSRLREDFEADQTRTLNEATGRGYLNQVADLKTGLDQGRRDAIAVGSDPAIVNRTIDAQLAQVLGSGNLDKSQLQEVIDSFGTEFPEAAAAAQTAMDNLVTVTDEIAKLNQSFADRKFAATTDTSTEAGALAAFDRQAAAERVEIARKAGIDLVAYDQAVAAERAKIQQDFAERLGTTNRSIQDRLVTATTDTSSLAGALSAFDRKTAQERAEIAKVAGADLVAFDAATAHERFKIHKEFADREAEVTRGLADRVFALSVIGKEDAEIQLLKHKQDAEYAAAEAAGYTVDQLNILSGVLQDELAHATAELAKRKADAEAQVTRGLADRVFTLSVSGKEDGEIQLLRRKQEAEMEAARAAGWTADQLTVLSGVLAGEMAQALDAVRERTDALNSSLQDRLFAATTDTSTLAGALASFDRKTAQERAELAKTTGADLISFDQATAAERLAIVKQFAEQAAAIDRSFADRLFAATQDTSTLAGALAAFDRQAARDRAEAAKTAGVDMLGVETALAAERANIVKQFAEQAAAIDRSFADRLFAATQDTSTLAGALAAFDRQAARDRAEAAKTAGVDMLGVETALAAERANIVKQFAEQAAAIDRSFADRLFAATNDAETLQGALAAFDRQAARDRAEAAKTAGVDMLGVETALAAERANIVKQFAEQAAAIDRSFADRLFAATNDAETLQGALAAFDRQAARDRAEAAKTAGIDMLGVEKALAAERATIVKRFADQAIEQAQAAADQARDRLVEALNREAEAARNLADSWKQAGQGLREALKADQLSDQYSALNPQDQARLAEEELRRLSARARDGSLTAQQRLEAANALPAARRAFLDAVRPLYEGTERWGEALALSASLLDGVALSADLETDLAQRQVDLAEGQLQALGIVNDSVLTVAEAMEQYQQAIAKLAEVRNNPTPEATAAPAPPAPAPVSQAPAEPAGVPANTNLPAMPSLEQVRADLLAAVDRRTPYDGQTILTWYRPDGSPLGLFEQELATRPLDYLLETARRAGLAGYQAGGIVGNGIQGVDSVLARYQGGGYIALAGGEFVVRSPSVTAETTPVLRAINDTGRVPAGLQDKAALGTKRMEALLEGLLTQATADGRRQADLDARGYEAMIERLEALLNQSRDAAADSRRTAR